MLWNDRFVFLHYPKTAGKSLSKAFVTVWPRPIHGLVTAGHIGELADCEQEGLHVEVGIGHENMKKTAQVLAERDIDIAALDAVFVGIRNPYDLMVSNYFYMRKLYEKHADRPNFQLAHDCDFDEYCEKVRMPKPEHFLAVDGKIPENIELIHFESLADDVARLAERFGFPVPELPHLNPSEHGHYARYLNARAAKAIEEKYAYFFDLGGYPRHDFGA